MKGRKNIKRIGILGGCFDPPHIGHIICSLVVGEEINLDQIILMPVAIQPQRSGGAIADAELRYRMVRAISELDPIFIPSRLEIDRAGISFTIRTLEQLIKNYPSPDHQLYWIIGMDSAIHFDTWREPEKIVELAKLVVMRRPGFSRADIPTKLRDKMNIIQTPHIDISSTMIRHRITNDLPIRPWVGEIVKKIIISERLYKS